MYLTHKNISKYWVIDCETDDLKASIIWVCIVKNCESLEIREIYNEDQFKEWYKKDYILVGHNAISFDIPTINRLWHTDIDINTILDTLVCSYLYNSALDSGHSLAAWGQRLKKPKGEFSDFSKLSPEMVSYCRQDVEVTYELFKQLTRRMVSVGFSELSCEIEHRTRILIDEQEEYGAWFDLESAKSLRDKLYIEQSDLSKRIRELFPKRLEKVAEYQLRRRKDGSVTAQYEKHREKYPRIVDLGETYECWDYKEFNLGSPKQRIERLLELGWEPVNFTKKGNPKVDEDALLDFAEASGRKEISALAGWLVLQGRLTMIAGNPVTGSKGWIGNVQDDSRIHGKIFSCGAANRRMRHTEPNTSNIPTEAKAKYGKECRALWGVEPGLDLIEVGTDASGLENVGLLHYLDSGEATRLLNQGKPNDIHSLNSRLMSKLLKKDIDRDTAKTAWFANIYGCYPKKLGLIVKGSESDGELVQEAFYRNCPGLEKATKDIQQEWRKNNGRLVTIDGGTVLCPSAHAAFNYKISSLGAIVMKLAAILLKDEADKISLWYRTFLTVHDEWQKATKTKDGDTLGKLAVSCIEEAARKLKFRVPLTGEYRLGLNWSQTH